MIEATTLLAAGGDCCPHPFIVALPRLATSTLSYQTIYHTVSDLLFAVIVRRLQTIHLQETEVIVRQILVIKISLPRLAGSSLAAEFSHEAAETSAVVSAAVRKSASVAASVAGESDSVADVVCEIASCSFLFVSLGGVGESSSGPLVNAFTTITSLIRASSCSPNRLRKSTMREGSKGRCEVNSSSPIKYCRPTRFILTQAALFSLLFSASKKSGVWWHARERLRHVCDVRPSRPEIKDRLSIAKRYPSCPPATPNSIKEKTNVTREICTIGEGPTRK